jgi:hypothetical protein
MQRSISPTEQKNVFREHGATKALQLTPIFLASLDLRHSRAGKQPWRLDLAMMPNATAYYH